MINNVLLLLMSEMIPKVLGNQAFLERQGP